MDQIGQKLWSFRVVLGVEYIVDLVLELEYMLLILLSQLEVAEDPSAVGRLFLKLRYICYHRTIKKLNFL